MKHLKLVIFCTFFIGMMSESMAEVLVEQFCFQDIWFSISAFIVLFTFVLIPFTFYYILKD